MWMPRARFASFWVSQVARVLADWALRITVFQMLVSSMQSAWHVVTAIFILPFILLAPFCGSVSNSLPKRWVLVFSSLFCFAVAWGFTLTNGPWLIALGLTALGSALYGPTRYAVLPAIAEDTKIALSRIVAMVDLGGTVAIVVGVIIGLKGYNLAEEFQSQLLTVIIALNCVSTIAAFPAFFRSDVRRSEGPLQSVIGFFKDCKRVFNYRPAWASLTGLACFQGLVTAGSGAVVTQALTRGSTTQEEAMVQLVLVSVGIALGCALAGLQPHIRRSLGLVSLGAVGLAIAQCFSALGMDDAGFAPRWAVFIIGMMSGLINVPLRSAYQASVPADARGNAMAVMYTLIYVITTIFAGLLIGLISMGWLAAPRDQMWFLTGLGVFGAILAGKILLPQTIELIAEFILMPIYRIRAHGPGKDKIPTKGPVILVANHSAYVDPFWLGKIVPRKLTPMMTSRFFDLPIIRWLMIHIVKAIRVQDSGFRREAPELQEAIDVLQQGGCLVVFPESKLRRTEERMLRKFGQGLWHILKAMPNVPVILFWIEGGWGSYASYKNGPPFKNKKMDRGRPIDIAVTEPRLIDPELLEDHRALRHYLMQEILNARAILGLEVPNVDDVLRGDAEQEMENVTGG